MMHAYMSVRQFFEIRLACGAGLARAHSLFHISALHIEHSLLFFIVNNRELMKREKKNMRDSWNMPLRMAQNRRAHTIH